MQNVFGSEDPYYEEVSRYSLGANSLFLPIWQVGLTGFDKQQVQVTKKNGKTKTKRVWKDPPSEGLSKNDAKVLKRVTHKAWRLDMLFSMCGLRLGWSAVIGILPVIGDVINLYMALKLVRLAQTVDDGLPPFVVSKMMTNITVDFALGFTPVVGIVMGALYKANSRNSLILEHFLKKRAKKNVAKGMYVLDPTTGAKKKPWFGWGRAKTTPSEEEQGGELDEQRLLHTESPSPLPTSKPSTSMAKPKPGAAPTLPPRANSGTPPASVATPPLPHRGGGLPPTAGQSSGSYQQ